MRSMVSGPCEVCGVCDSCAEAVCAANSTSPRAMVLLFILPPQAHVERCRVAAPHLHLGDVGSITRLADLDGVPPFGDFDQQLISIGRPMPPLAVDQHIRVSRLKAECERAVAVGR